MSVVYFIQAGAGGPIKIGWAADLKKRIASLQCGNPEPLVVLAALPGERRAESYLHQRLSCHRYRGEWFNPDVPVLEVVEEAKNGRLDTRVSPRLHGLIIVAHGVGAIARQLTISENTVRGWLCRDSIPAKYWRRFVDAGWTTYEELLAGIHRRSPPRSPRPTPSQPDEAKAA